MPSVCTCDCGLTTDAEGRLCLDWTAVRERAGVETSDAFSSSVGATTEGYDRARAVRAQVCNTSCRTQRVTYEGVIPHINFNMDGIPNYWDAVLYTTAELGTAPDGDSFSLTTAARFRHNNQSATVKRVSGVLHTPRKTITVPPGECANMIASFWRSIIDRSGDSDVNLLSYPRLELRWWMRPA